VLRTVDAVLFDMDGLLVDSEPLWTIAEIELAEKLGGMWGDEIKAAVVGTRIDTAMAVILEWYDAPRAAADVEAAIEFLLGRVVELFHDHLPLMPGALELIDAVRDAGARTALVSSSYRVLVEAALEEMEPHRFDTTISGDEVTNGKPDPEPYALACDRLGIPPAKAVVIEDAMSGVTSGEAAGCLVVAVPYVAPIESTPQRPVVGSLAEIDPGWLLNLVV